MMAFALTPQHAALTCNHTRFLPLSEGRNSLSTVTQLETLCKTLCIRELRIYKHGEAKGSCLCGR